MDLDAVEPVVMIGYPNGLWDHVNNLPLMRRGVTASHPGIDFKIEGSKGAPVTVVDMACFPGSSGSPVFAYSSGVYATKDGSTSVGTRAVFLGVLASGPIMQADGKIVVRDIPTVATPIPQMRLMLNLGYVIKAREIVVLGKHLYAQRGIKYPEGK
jgi:hypothetical protein